MFNRRFPCSWIKSFVRGSAVEGHGCALGGRRCISQEEPRCPRVRCHTRLLRQFLPRGFQKIRGRDPVRRRDPSAEAQRAVGRCRQGCGYRRQLASILGSSMCPGDRRLHRLRWQEFGLCQQANRPRRARRDAAITSNISPTASSFARCITSVSPIQRMFS